MSGTSASCVSGAFPACDRRVWNPRFGHRFTGFGGRAGVIGRATPPLRVHVTDPPLACMSTLPQQKIDEVRSIFQAFLKKRNKRQTPERFAVLEEIYKTDDHVDADELYVRLKQDGTRVSRATVYNTLELLLECDLVVRHQFGKNQAKYERAYSYWQHDHLICMDCNELLEFCDPRLQSIQEMVADIYEFDIKHHSLNMYGHCMREDCPNRAEAEDEEEGATEEA